MVRTLSKIAIALGALLALLLALLAVLLPRLMESDEIQTTLRAHATEALGAPVDWTGLEVALIPPRLVLEAPRLVADSASAQGWGLSADSIDLRLALGGLLRRRVEIDSLVLRGIELVVTRTADGLQLPLVAAGPKSSARDGFSSPDAPSTPSPPDARPSEAPADVDERSSVALDLHRLVIEGGRIVLRDRTRAEPIDWQLEDLRLEARGSGSGGAEPIGIDASARLISGTREIGALATTGTLTRAGLYDLVITIEALLLGELAAAPPEDLSLEGRLSGRIALEGHRTGVDPVDFVAELDLAGNGGEVQVEGRLERDGAVDAKARLDAVDLAVVAPMLEAGTRVEGALTGRLELRMKADRTIEQIDTDLRLETARLVHAPVDLMGTAALVMRLEGAGPASVEGRLQLADGGRLDLEGTATLDGVLDVAGEIERFDLSIAAPFLPGPEMEIDGLATGKLRLLGAVTAPERIGLDVSIETGRLRIPDYAVDGPFSLKLEVKEPISARRRGTLDLDLTAARVGYRDRFVKRAGRRAEMASRFMPDAKGEIVFESRIQLHDIDEILLQGLVGASMSVVATTPTFELDGRISGQVRDAADFRRSVGGRFAFTVGREGGGACAESRSCGAFSTRFRSWGMRRS